MSQANPSDDAVQSEETVALIRLESMVAHLDDLVRELLAEEEETAPPPPRNGNPRHSRRFRYALRFDVITGGLAVFVAAALYLPPQLVPAPAREVAVYTVSALIREMPSSIPDPPDVGSLVIGNPDRQHRPLHPVAMVKAVLPADVADVAVTPALSPPPQSTATASTPNLPVVQATSAPATPTPTAAAGPTAAPAAAAPSATAASAAPVAVPAAAPASAPAVDTSSPAPALTPATPDPTPSPAPAPAPTPDPTPVPSPTVAPSASLANPPSLPVPPPPSGGAGSPDS